MNETMMRLLRDLPSAEPDPARSERTRILCRTRVAARITASTSDAPSRLPGRQIWQPLLAVVAFAYIAEALGQALRTYGLR
jgi:hypothetical protein